jgi:hypothetical protein
VQWIFENSQTSSGAYFSWFGIAGKKKGKLLDIPFGFEAIPSIVGGVALPFLRLSARQI